MDGLLGNGGTLADAITKIKDELGTGTDKLGKVIEGGTAGQKLNFSAAYTKFETAVTAATDIIDKALETNDLTELDTTNLKALRSYITETKATFDAAAKESGLSTTAENDVDKVTDDSLAKLKAGLKSATELGKTATEKATATHKFSQNQPETVADMRAQLKTFVGRSK